MEILRIRTSKRNETIDITELVKEKIKKLKIKNGICFLYVPHTTAAIIINENYDESVMDDLLEFLAELVPRNRAYRHLEGNADAHIKSSILGNTLSIIIKNGELCLGKWQGIIFLEFDGPREREVWFKILTIFD